MIIYFLSLLPNRFGNVTGERSMTAPPPSLPSEKGLLRRLCIVVTSTLLFITWNNLRKLFEFSQLNILPLLMSFKY